MIAQVALLVLLCAILAYAIQQRRRSRPVAYFIVAVVLAGMTLVVFPDLANRIAELVGIGRGADLAFYVTAVIGLAAIFNLHLRLRSTGETVTKLARSIALLSAKSPKD
jgi:hypothetical protein